MSVFRIRLMVLCFLLSSEINAQLPEGTFSRRISSVSNFEFAIGNNGLIWGDRDSRGGAEPVFAPPIAHWPRGSFHMLPWGIASGFVMLAKKEGRLLVSDNGYVFRTNQAHGPFNQMVPGRIDDPNAGMDTVFGKSGWPYVDDPDYVVYSSLDFGEEGIDITGANYNDWPVRHVNGEAHYVGDPLARRRFPPSYRSEEDLFCVFKDTDTRADQIYNGPDGPSIPIGIEVRNSVLTWGAGPLRDIVVFEYAIHYADTAPLESCYVAFGSALEPAGPSQLQIARGLREYLEDPSRRLVVLETHPTHWPGSWTATPVRPTVGYSMLRSPVSHPGNEVGMMYGGCKEKVNYFADSSSGYEWIGRLYVPDSTRYRVFSNPQFPQPTPSWQRICDSGSFPILITHPFPMLHKQIAYMDVAIIFSDSLPHLLLLHDLIKRMHANNYQRPSAPPAPQLTAKGLNRAVKLTWDTRAEQSEDIIIPDSLGRPFVGYRLLRAAREEGPYTELARWHVDSALVHEYIDRGEDIGGLKNNVRYYYQLLSFDEGAPRIKLEPMESKPEKGVNWQSVVPGTDPADATAQGATGTLAGGTLGDVGIPELIPINTTNYNSFLSGRTIQLRINAATDGMRYTLPVTIRDTVAGREQNTILEPGLFVHGTPQTAGIKEGSVSIRDVLGLGAADITIPYRFEQLPDSLHIAQPVIHSTTGADVPIIVRDSLNVTGIQSITPRVTSGREIVVEFLAGGRDTLSILFGIILDYMNVRITDAETGDEYEPMVDWVLQPYIVRSTGGTSSPGRRNRYYLSGEVPNGQYYDAGHLLTIHQSAIAFDYPDRGQGSGKPQPLFPWGSGHRQGTQDFRAGDRVRITWDGGVKGRFPENALVELTGPPPGRRDVTDEMMENIRVVPNPFLIRHEAQRGEPRIYFNYLPDECTIRIYTIALDLVKTIQHRGGSRVEWDLATEGGQLVASQMLIAHIEAPNGKSTTKKFSVIVGR